MAIKLLSDSDAQGKSQPSGQPLTESRALVHPHPMPQPQDHSAPHGVKRLADITTHPSLILLLLLRLCPLGFQSHCPQSSLFHGFSLYRELSLACIPTGQPTASGLRTVQFLPLFCQLWLQDLGAGPIAWSGSLHTLGNTQSDRKLRIGASLVGTWWSRQGSPRGSSKGIRLKTSETLQMALNLAEPQLSHQ